MSARLKQLTGTIAIGCTALAGSLSLLSAEAHASPGCDAANAGTFNQTAPANTNVFTQVGGSFDNGDTIFATVTGTPLGVGVDLLPGPEGILFINGANGSGSRLVTTNGPRTIDITLAGGPGGPAVLTFTCTPAGGGGGPGDDQAQANTATNNGIIIDNQTVQGILDDILGEDPEPPVVYATPEQSQERAILTGELSDLRAEAKDLEKEIATAESNAAFLERRGRQTINEAGDDYEPESEVNAFAALLVPVDVSGAMEDMEEDQDMAAGRAMLERAKQRRADAEKLKQDLQSNRTRQAEIENRLKELPPDEPNDFTPPDPEDLGDGDAILFAARDPFMRAIDRMRGFRLDATDIGNAPGPNVTPLSLTRTLDGSTVGWIRAIYTDYEQNDASQQDGEDLLISVGAHRDFTPDLRVGAFVTAKWGEVISPVNNLDIDTTGYSFGIYGRYMLDKIALNASTRLGITDSDILSGGNTGSYDTRLASATFGVSGEEQLADNIWMTPAASVTLTWTNREDYRNSAGTAINGSTTWSGNVSAGPTINWRVAPPDGFTDFTPGLGLQATYQFSDADNQSGTVSTTDSDYLSLSVSPQLSMTMENGMSLDLFGSYFGIGADLDGWSVGGTISIPLN